jgi:hypothetical protein
MPINWPNELPLIITAANKYNVDPRFIQAIRAQENGGEGKQFGVLDGALTYQQQLDECCATVAHRLESYPANPIMRCYGASGRSRVRYNPSFVSYFASIWAPLRVKNDPTNLNANWYHGVSSFYAKFVQEDLA